VNRRLADGVVLGGILVALLSLAWSLAGRFVLDIDDCNLALAVEKFDVRMHQPHPPGYLGYVMLLRLARLLSTAALLDVPRWTARLSALATVLLTWQSARNLGADELRARMAALLCATNPILLYYAVDGQTHAAEAAMSAALVWSLAAPRSSWSRAVGCGLLLAAGGSFRPTYLLLAGPAVLWAYRHEWRRLLAVGAIAAAGTFLWLYPTVKLTGGWAAYRAANDALVGVLAGRTSLLSSSGEARYVALNLRDAAIWGAIALAPALALRPRLDEATRRAAWICALIAVPSMIFYAVVICAEAGYLSGLVAPAAVLGGLWLRRRWAPIAVAVAQLAFFLAGPQRIFRSFMLPDVQEIVERDLRAGFLFDALHHDLAPDARVLALSDFPDLSLMRQFPLLRPATEVLFAHDRRYFAAGGQSWISHATRHGWHAAPGIVLRNDGDDTSLRGGGYDLVVLDPRSSDTLRAALAAQTSCPVAAQSEEEARAAQRWPSSCFRSPLIFYDLKFYF
jgi:hypothetical protein